MGTLPEDSKQATLVRQGGNLLDLDRANGVAQAVEQTAQHYRTRLGHEAEALMTS